MNVAKKIVLSLLEEYEREVLATDGSRPLPRSCDLLALASLLCISEHCPVLNGDRDIEDSISKCRRAVVFVTNSATRQDTIRFLETVAPFERCPFDTSSALMFEGTLIGADLVPYLSHPNSSIRYQMFEIAWLVRQHLPKDESLDRLFKNIADTLGYVEQAMGLARGLCESEEEFFDRADAYNCDELFAKQYLKRIQFLKEDKYYLVGLQKKFLAYENGVRKVITDRVLGYELSEASRDAVQQQLFK